MENFIPLDAIFLNTTSIVSPTSARKIGPSTPRCLSAAVRSFCSLNCASVYSRYTTFLYFRPIRSSPPAVNVFASLKEKSTHSQVMMQRKIFCATNADWHDCVCRLTKLRLAAVSRRMFGYPRSAITSYREIVNGRGSLEYEKLSEPDPSWHHAQENTHRPCRTSDWSKNNSAGFLTNYTRLAI